MAELTQAVLRDWFQQTTGPVSLEKAKRELNVSPSAYNKLRVYFGRLVKEGVAEHVGDKDGIYRLIEDEPEDVDIFAKETFADIILPFDLHHYALLERGQMIQIAGSPGSGKTAICLQTAYLNGLAGQSEVFYWGTKEAGRKGLIERLRGIDPGIEPPLPFHLKVLRLGHATHIAKHPNAIHIIDYLDLDDTAYMIGRELKQIVDALDEGVAIVAIQKPFHRDEGLGGIYTLKTPQIILALDKERIRITKHKAVPNNGLNASLKEWKFTVDRTRGGLLVFEDNTAPVIRTESQVPF